MGRNDQTGKRAGRVPTGTSWVRAETAVNGVVCRYRPCLLVRTWPTNQAQANPTLPSSSACSQQFCRSVSAACPSVRLAGCLTRHPVRSGAALPEAQQGSGIHHPSISPKGFQGSEPVTQASKQATTVTQGRAGSPLTPSGIPSAKARLIIMRRPRILSSILR